MNVGVASSNPNPNRDYFNSRGMWVTYLLVLFVGHYVLLSIPTISVAWAWTLTHIIHNVVMFMILHMEKGTPFETTDQAKSRYMTVWEQLDNGKHFSASKKFLTIVPVCLFFLASFYSKFDKLHFVINAVAVMISVVAKLPIFHGVRIFGINKY